MQKLLCSVMGVFLLLIGVKVVSELNNVKIVQNSNEVPLHVDTNTAYTYAVDWINRSVPAKLVSQIALQPTIAILDTGVDVSNPYFKNSKITEYNLASTDHEDIHGTEVAGILVAKGPELTGLLPNAKLISIKIGGDQGWTIQKLIEGLELARSLHPDVINISSGTTENIPELQAEIHKVVEQGITIVASAGNYAQDTSDYPAAYPEVLSVGAIDRSSNLTAHTDFGEKVKIFAPGEDILTVSGNKKLNELTRFQGTSAAAPFVTGLAAILKSKHKQATPQEIMNMIVTTADVFQENGQTIHVVNFKNALNDPSNKE